MNNRFSKRYCGLSSDRRTNRWELTCICGKSWKPTTTMMGSREERCPKCQKAQVVFYNKPGEET